MGSTVLRGLTVGILLASHGQEPGSASSVLDETAPLAQASPRTTEGHRIKEPERKKHVAPEYPESARRAGLYGSVILECVIDIEGRVEDVRVVKGYRSLAAAAEKAVRKWRYTTTELDGKAVKVIMTVTVNFKLRALPRRDEVLASLSDAEPEIRWAAISWLGRYRPVTGEQRTGIERALKDPSELVRRAANEALARLEAR